MLPEKCLLLKDEALSLDLQNPHKNWVWWSLTLVLGVGDQEGKDVETGGLLGGLLLISRPLRFSEKLCLKT